MDSVRARESVAGECALEGRANGSAFPSKPQRTRLGWGTDLCDESEIAGSSVGHLPIPSLRNFRSLPDYLHGELEHSRLSGGSNLAEVGIGHITVRVLELRVIESVEGIGSKLEH